MMKKVYPLMMVVAATVALAGCKDTHDVAWWKAHPVELKQELAKCGNDPGERKYAPNCVNAKKAKDELILDAHNKGVPQLIFKKAPTLGGS